MKIFPAAMAAVLFAAIPITTVSAQAVQSPAAPLDLKTWGELARNERQSMVLAAIEGFFLAAAGNPQLAQAIDEQCLASLTPKKVEKQISKEAEDRPGASFTEVFFEVATCDKKEDK